MTYTRNTRTARAVDPAAVSLTVLGATGAPITSAVWVRSPTGALLLVIFAVTTAGLVTRALSSRAEDYPLTVGRVLGWLLAALFSAFGYVIMWLGMTALLALLAAQGADGDLSPAAAFGTAFGLLVAVTAALLFVFGVLSLLGAPWGARRGTVPAVVSAPGTVQRAASAVNRAAVEEAETRPDVTAEGALAWVADNDGAGRFVDRSEVRRLAGQVLLSVAPPTPTRHAPPAPPPRPVPIDCPYCGRPSFAVGGTITPHDRPGTPRPCNASQARQARR